MSRRQESIPYILVHDCPWWVSTMLAGVIYALMRWVAPAMAPDDPLLGPLTKALPSAAWMGAGLLLMLAGLNLVLAAGVRRLVFEPASRRARLLPPRMSRADPRVRRPRPAMSFTAAASMIQAQGANVGPNAGKPVLGLCAAPGMRRNALTLRTKPEPPPHVWRSPQPCKRHLG
jgi:hypothetical protein